jgi:Sec-independent protein translocase protein TatA
LGSRLGQALRGFKKAMEGDPKKLEFHETQNQEERAKKMTGKMVKIQKIKGETSKEVWKDVLG